MYRFKRILVGLDCSEADESVIRYAGMISRLAEAETVFFMHVRKLLDIPEKIRERYIETENDRILGQRIKQSIKEYFNGHASTKVLSEVLQGNAYFELLKKQHEAGIDLIVLGKHHRKRPHNKSLTERLARKASSSVLIVPSRQNARITNILVPVDFSKDSANALEVAIALASSLILDFVSVHRAYNVPQEYIMVGKSYNQFVAELREVHEDMLKDFVSSINFGKIGFKTIYTVDMPPAYAILKTAERGKFDLIVLGSRGKNAWAAVFLGSVAEELIRTSQLPLLVVKDKTKERSFFERFFKTESKIK